jgi:hypothetical protein
LFCIHHLVSIVLYPRLDKSFQLCYNHGTCSECIL